VRDEKEARGAVCHVRSNGAREARLHNATLSSVESTRSVISRAAIDARLCVKGAEMCDGAGEHTRGRGGEVLAREGDSSVLLAKTSSCRLLIVCSVRVSVCCDVCGCVAARARVRVQDARVCLCSCVCVCE
jgi:hypothetical protein